jgi:hypothetical protein
MQAGQCEMLCNLGLTDSKVLIWAQTTTKPRQAQQWRGHAMPVVPAATPCSRTQLRHTAHLQVQRVELARQPSGLVLLQDQLAQRHAGAGRALPAAQPMAQAAVGQRVQCHVVQVARLKGLVHSTCREQRAQRSGQMCATVSWQELVCRYSSAVSA